MHIFLRFLGVAVGFIIFCIGLGLIKNNYDKNINKGTSTLAWLANMPHVPEQQLNSGITLCGICMMIYFLFEPYLTRLYNKQ